MQGIKQRLGKLEAIKPKDTFRDVEELVAAGLYFDELSEAQQRRYATYQYPDFSFQEVVYMFRLLYNCYPPHIQLANAEPPPDITERVQLIEQYLYERN